MERISFKDLPKGLMQSLVQVQNYVDHSGLDFRLLELIRMRVSQINSCAYCLDMHLKEGIEAGDTALRLVSVSAWRETDYYSASEQTALEFAEILTHLPSEQHSDTIHDSLSAHFSKDEIAHLTLAIVQINSWNRIVRSFGVVAGRHQVVKKHVVAAN